MIAVSELFKNAMKQPVKEIQAFIDYDEHTITDGDDLISYKISCDSGLCKTAMRKLEAKFLGNHNLLGRWVKVGYGARLPDGMFEFLNYGSFMVTEQTITKDTNTTNIVAYDKMINTMQPYAKTDVEYPLNLYDYTKVLCEACGLELGSELFGYNLWDVSKQKGLNNITYDNTTDIYSSTDNDTRTSLIYKMQQYIAMDYIEDTFVTNEITKTGVYTFTSKRVENATNIRIANLGTSREFSVFYPIPNDIAVGDTFTVSLEIVDATIGASKFKNVMLHKGNSVLSYMPYNTMNAWQISQELWGNIDGITYRDIFQQIAQATASTCIIGADDKVYFKPLTDTGERLTYDNLFKLKLEAIYGDINSVVLSRTPSEDNIYLKNEASVETNGLTEFRIENNEIIDKDRENAITPIFEALNGICYYPFEATTEGLGWYEIADNITIVNDLGEEFKTSLFNYTITINGSVKETLKTSAETKTQTQYQYATSISKRVKNTELMVNKQEDYIKSLVSDMYEEDGVVNQKYTSIYQDIESIVQSVQNSGGNNLIKNSVMFAYDVNYVPSDWELSGDGTITIATDNAAISKGGLSGHSFTLTNKIARQTIPVKMADGDNVAYYSFCTKIKKELVGECYVKIYNDNEEYIINLPSGESADYTEYEIAKLKPSQSYYIVEFYADSGAKFTDNMFSMGEYKSQWTQANGEVMNTQVNINIDGVVVKSSTYIGDYTVISPLEFAGYSNVDGTTTKVFTLNRDVTEIKKLLARDEITMNPIKIVPITSGELQGWAFVPYTKEE